VTQRRTPKAPEDTGTPTASPFEIAPALARGDDTGSVRLGPFERLYETLFAEALESGEISPEERERLDLAAAALGLDAARVARLEEALLEAWESQAAETLVDPRSAVHAEPDAYGDGPPPTPAAPEYGEEPEPPTVPRTSRRSRRSGAPVEVSFRELHARYEAAALDDRLRLAEVLVLRGAATAEQQAFWNAHRQAGPIRPLRSLTAEAWTSLLLHPDEDRTTSEVFGVIASASLLGRVSAMRRDGTLPKLDPESFQDPLTSPVPAVRALAWAAATLGIRTPPTYVVPDHDTGLEIVPVVPPSTRVGARALASFGPAQLAFAAGRHLSWFREEHFICTLVPSVPYLETIFYAALLLGAPKLSLPDDVRERARAFSQAIVPCLEPAQMEKLRRLVARFLARGGRTNLKRWARAAEWTACRTGLLLCGELQTAVDALANEPGGEARITQLETFWVSSEAGTLRAQLGVALNPRSVIEDHEP
jgi:hypothetical protein